MLTLVIVLASIAAYLFIGSKVAMGAVPQLWVRARKNWSTEHYVREAVVAGVVARWLCWPVMCAYELLARSIDARDPKEAERRKREMEARIAELERELGLK